MRKYKLKHGGRCKALTGELLAAGIQAGATAAAAATQAAATTAAAKQSADATIKAAKQNSDALTKQNENNTKLQEESIEFTKEQNQENRDLQQQIQTNLQILAGKQNTDARLDASRIQVKNGGSVRRKLKSTTPVEKNGNMKFRVTDGGGVLPIAKTPEGYDLYEIVGDDHEHYHKTAGGKNKTGVGFKFANGKVIEGEGNQNSNQGELLLVTPKSAAFISKHSIKGFNPAKAVEAGMNPKLAFNRQEDLKGSRKRMQTGGMTPITLNNMSRPDLSVDTTAAVAAASAYGSRDKAKCGRKLKCGGRVKAKTGWYNGLSDYEKSNVQGSMINTGANIIGAGLQSVGNWIGNGITRSANRQAASIMTDAYSKMKGIDLDNIKLSDYQGAHTMAALQAPIVDSNAQRTAVERERQRSLKNIGRGTMSSAVAQARMNKVNVNAHDLLGQIQEQDNKTKQAIHQHNMDAINQASQTNAQLDSQARQSYMAARLEGLKYNNDIENAKIQSIAETQSGTKVANAAALSNTLSAEAQSWGSALSNSANTIGNAFQANADMRNKQDQTYFAASREDQINWVMARNEPEKAKALYDLYKGSSDAKNQEIAARLNNKYHFDDNSTQKGSRTTMARTSQNNYGYFGKYNTFNRDINSKLGRILLS